MTHVYRWRQQAGASVRFGLVLGAVFGAWNFVAAQLEPLSEDTPAALFLFYGPMFTMWALAGFAAVRESGQLRAAVVAGGTVALVTFVLVTLEVIIRINLTLETVRERSDWQNLVSRFQFSDFRSVRAYANYVYLREHRSSSWPQQALAQSAGSLAAGLL